MRLHVAPVHAMFVHAMSVHVVSVQVMSVTAKGCVPAMFDGVVGSEVKLTSSGGK